MAKINLGTITGTVVALMLVLGCPMEASATDVQGVIRTLEARFATAVRAKDIDQIMANYTVSEALVVFDADPPRQYTGWQAYKEHWKKILAGCKDTPEMAISDLEIYGGARFAYSHSIQHFACTNQQGKKLDLILRVTDGYANFGGEWLIAHEHVSVPVDLTTGQALLQSKP